jgi:hypothetical protein
MRCGPLCWPPRRRCDRFATKVNTGERLLESPVDWYGPAILVNKTTVEAHPHSLARLPVLLPTGHSALRP